MNVEEPASDPERLEALERQVVHALRIHQVWRETLRATVSPHPRRASLAPEAACPLHTWLTAQLDPSFRRLPLYARTRAAHGEFHRSIEVLIKSRAPGAPMSADASSAARQAAASATALKDCLDEWLTLARHR